MPECSVRDTVGVKGVPPAARVPQPEGYKIMVDRLVGYLALVQRAFGIADRGLGPFLDLAIRLSLAGLFWSSAIVKLANWPVALELARVEYPLSWMDPVAAAWLGVAIELICPVFLAFGLFTRLAALPLIALSLIIQYEYLALPEHLFWAILLGLIAVRGAGALSLDHLFGRALARAALPGASFGEAAFAALTRYGGPGYQLFIRLWMANIFWQSGLVKLQSWQTTLFLFEYEYQIPIFGPVTAAYLGTATELAAPVLLAFGLGARFAAVPLIVMTGFIQFTYLDKMEHFYWMMLFAQTALRGAGPLSLDFAIGRLLAKRFPQLTGKPAFSLDGLPRVVVVGAGFAGLAAARGLALARARVTVVDRWNYHLFQPLLYQVATASLAPADIATPTRSLLRDQFNTRVLLDKVTGVDAERKEVVMGENRIPYDYLVLATGARHSYFGKDDWEAFAPGLKQVDDATAIRSRILSAFERAEACDEAAERRRLLSFVIVGGGPTGVELAGAIAELARFGLEKEFRNFDPADARVVLIQSPDRVLPSFPEDLSVKAKSALEDLGVEVRVGARVEHVDADGAVVAGGERIEARTVLWAAGVIASPAARWLDAAADTAGRVKVETDFSVPGRPDIFVVGDTALAVDAAGRTLPGLAPAAKQAGEQVAKLIKARLAGKPEPKTFRYKDMGSMATIGRKSAIADFGHLRLSGMPAWWLWGLVHVAFLTGARNRLSVMVEWGWAYLTYRRSIRLITGTGN